MPHIQVGKTTKALLDDPDFGEWSDEELLGIKRDKHGGRSGPQPKVVPMARIYEINRRLFSNDFIEMAAKIEDIRKYLIQVAMGEIRPDKERIDVCKWIYERIFGKTPISIDLQPSEPSEYSKSGVTKAIVIRDVIDAESHEPKAIEAKSHAEPEDSQGLAENEEDDHEDRVEPGSMDDPFK